MLHQQGEDTPIHADHRQRMKNRFLNSGLDDFSDVQVLEMLLFYCIPRKDTNPIAHKLISNFGSFSQVMEAPAEELAKVEGVGMQAATFLSFVTQVGRYYMVNQAQQNTVLTTINECGKYLMPYFYGRRNETVYLLCLDAKCKVLCCKKIGEGSVNSAGVPIRRIVETALGANATSVILAHNHPSGIATPSEEDMHTSCRVAAALSTVDIVLADHIVVSDDDFVSLKQTGFRFKAYEMN